MADFDSALPIRTENNGDAVVRISDGTITSQLLEVDSSGRITSKISDGTDSLAINADGSINITDNGGTLTVDQSSHDNLNANANIQVGNVDVANGNPVPVSDAGGSLTVDATDLDIRDLTHVSDSIKVGDGTDFLSINTDGSVNINLRDESGTAYSSTNPLQVVVIESEGDEINDHNAGSAVAGGASSNHDYTVTALKTLQLTQIEASATGKAKIEVQIETAVASGVFNSKFVQFNSTANPNMSIMLKEPISVAAGVRVRVIRTNRENQAQDLYSTISGHEV